MINQFYHTLLTVLNKYQRGKISPSEFNSMLYEGCKTIYVELFADFRKLDYKKARLQTTPNYGSESINLKQCLEFWVEENDFEVGENGKFNLPSKMAILNGVFGGNVQYYKKDLKAFNILSRSSRLQPSSCMPIFTLFNNTMKVFPIPEDKSVTIDYFRYVKEPKWTFNIVNGVEVFNPDAQDFQDIDIHPLLLHRLFVEVLGLCGLNLGQNEVQNYVTQMKQEDFANLQ